MPRASSRSSASAMASFSAARRRLGGRCRVELRLQQPQVERERDELLLGAVVEVALDRRRAWSAASTMRTRETRSSSTRARRSAFSRSLSIASAAPAAAALDELRPGVELGVVDDRRDAAAVALDRGPRAARAGLGQRRPVAGLVDEDPALGQPVGDRQRAVAEALGEHLAHRAPRRARRGEQRARERARAGREPLERGDREEPAASASAHSSRPVSGPSVHGPT